MTGLRRLLAERLRRGISLPLVRLRFGGKLTWADRGWIVKLLKRIGLWVI